MASSKEYLDYVLEQATPTELGWRSMMGEYILYYDGRIVGGIYDDRLLVKPVPAARALLPQAAEEQPYPGAKPMLLVEEVDRRGFLAELFAAVGKDVAKKH